MSVVRTSATSSTETIQHTHEPGTLVYNLGYIHTWMDHGWMGDGGIRNIA